MENVFIELFLYLACVYFINGLLINLFRYLKIADFIANVMTGVIFGGILIAWGQLVGPEGVERLVGNKFINFVSYVGLMLFMMQLGFNFEPRFFNFRSNSVMVQAIIFVALNSAFLGAVCYYLLGIQETLPMLTLVIAFLTINIGSILSSNFPIDPTLKRPFTNLIQLAVILDVIAILLFSGIFFWLKVRGYEPADIQQDLINVAILAIFLIPILSQNTFQKIFSFLERWSQNYTVLLKLGTFFLFLYAGFQMGLSVLVLGLWAGQIFKSLSGPARSDIRHKFFPVATFVYILPFVEIGMTLVLNWEYAGNFIYHFHVVLLTLVVITVVFSLLGIALKNFTFAIAMGAFPRGELTVLILWLAEQIELIPKSMFVLSVSVVLVTSLLGRLLFLRPLVRTEELLDRPGVN